MKEKIKSWLKQSGWFTITAPADPLLDRFKEGFDYRERSFSWGWRKYLVKTLYCHASPGVIETSINELAALRPAPGTKLLNLGGGTGQVSAIFAKLGYLVSTVDIALEKADEYNVKWDLNHRPYPFAAGQFSVVVGQEIIEHIENPWEFFRQTKRILKPGGTLIVSTPNILSLLSRWRFLLTGYFPWFTPDCLAYHINPVPFWQFELIAKQTGFRLEKLLGSGDYLFSRTNESKKNVLNRNEEIILVFQSRS